MPYRYHISSNKSYRAANETYIIEYLNEAAVCGMASF